jgi:hypothetical protein
MEGKVDIIFHVTIELKLFQLKSFQGITTKSKPETDQSDCTISSKQMFPYTCKTAQLVTNLQQTYTNTVSKTLLGCVCLVPGCLLATRLLRSTGLLQIVSTTCYPLAIQQLANNLSNSIVAIEKMALLLQFVDKLARRLLRTHFVDKL